MYVSTLCVCGSLFTSGASQNGTRTATGNSGNDIILSQKVYGELVILMSFVRKLCVDSPSFSADHPNYMVLFRKYVSSIAAGKCRAVLEAVGLNNGVIETLLCNHQDVVDRVHLGLIEWSKGHQHKQPTWEVLLCAMEEAKIGEEHIEGLKTALGLH